MIVKLTKKQKRAWYATTHTADDRYVRRKRWESIEKNGWFPEKKPMVAILKKPEAK